MSGEIMAAVLDDFPPLYVLDSSGNPAGFAIDILTEVAAMRGLKVRYLVVKNWADAMQAVRSGEADLIPGIGISPERSGEFLFSELIETIPVSCFVRSKNYLINSIDKLQGHRVAVIDQSAAHTKLRKRKGLNLLTYPSIDSALVQLLGGDVDAFVFPEPVLWKKARQLGVGDKIKVVGKPLMELKRGYLLRKGDLDLRDKLNRAIEKFTHSRAYLDLYVKWYGKPDLFWNIRNTFLVMSGLLLLVAAAMAVWRYQSTLTVNRKLKENIAVRKKAEMELRRARDELEQKVQSRTKISKKLTRNCRPRLMNEE